MKSILVALSVGLLGLVSGQPIVFDDPILVNNLLDQALEELSRKVVARGDITEAVGTEKVGDYVISGARLADLTSLKRVGQAWMWNDYRTVIVNSTLSLGTMFLVHANISGPQSIPDPIITVSKNYVNFNMHITLDAKSHCSAAYYFQWTLINGVTLYSGNPEMCNIDLSSWVKKNMDSVNDLLVGPLSLLFEENIHMCQSRWLNKIEMLKYESFLKAEMMNNTFK